MRNGLRPELWLTQTVVQAIAKMELPSDVKHVLLAAISTLPQVCFSWADSAHRVPGLSALFIRRYAGFPVVPDPDVGSGPHHTVCSSPAIAQDVMPSWSPWLPSPGNGGGQWRWRSRREPEGRGSDACTGVPETKPGTLHFARRTMRSRSSAVRRRLRCSTGEHVSRCKGGAVYGPRAWTCSWGDVLASKVLRVGSGGGGW